VAPANAGAPRTGARGGAANDSNHPFTPVGLGEAAPPLRAARLERDSSEHPFEGRVGEDGEEHGAWPRAHDLECGTGFHERWHWTPTASTALEAESTSASWSAARRPDYDSGEVQDPPGGDPSPRTLSAKTRRPIESFPLHARPTGTCAARGLRWLRLRGRPTCALRRAQARTVLRIVRERRPRRRPLVVRAARARPIATSAPPAGVRFDRRSIPVHQNGKGRSQASPARQQVGLPWERGTYRLRSHAPRRDVRNALALAPLRGTVLVPRRRARSLGELVVGSRSLGLLVVARCAYRGWVSRALVATRSTIEARPPDGRHAPYSSASERGEEYSTRAGAFLRGLSSPRRAIRRGGLSRTCSRAVFDDPCRNRLHLGLAR